MWWSPARHRKALITGITECEGSYLAELLLEKYYVAHVIKRRASSINTSRVDRLCQGPHESDPLLVQPYGDLTGGSNLIRIIHLHSRMRSITSAHITMWL